MDVRDSNQPAAHKAEPDPQPLCCSGCACSLLYCLAPHSIAWDNAGPDSGLSLSLIEGQQGVKNYRLSCGGGGGVRVKSIQPPGIYKGWDGWMLTLKGCLKRLKHNLFLMAERVINVHFSPGSQKLVLALWHIVFCSVCMAHPN